MILLSGEPDVPSLTSFVQYVVTGGGTAVLVVFTYLMLTRKLVPGETLVQAEDRHKKEMEKAELRHAEECRKLEERREKFERLAWELVTTNRQLSGSAERATNLAEKAVAPQGARS
jgi:hypothetical protein